MQLCYACIIQYISQLQCPPCQCPIHLGVPPAQLPAPRLLRLAPRRLGEEKLGWDGLWWHKTWLVVWNMFFYLFIFFPYMGNNHPKWLSYFSEGLKPATRNHWNGLKWMITGGYTLMDWTPVWIIFMKICLQVTICELPVKVSWIWMQIFWRWTPFGSTECSGSSPTNAVLAFVDHVDIIPRNSNMAMENPQLFDDCAMNLHL